MYQYLKPSTLLIILSVVIIAPSQQGPDVGSMLGLGKYYIATHLFLVIM